MSVPDWVLQHEKEKANLGTEWWAENRHKGPDVPVLDGPCVGQRIRLPVIYAKVVLLSSPGSRQYHHYMYHYPTQSYKHRADLPIVPTSLPGWEVWRG
jgi:hypothetical protein